jgi:hypothetical protein
VPTRRPGALPTATHPSTVVSGESSARRYQEAPPSVWGQGRRHWRTVHWGVAGWRPTRTGLGGRALPATWPFCPGMRGARPQSSSPRCRICLACKFGSCHASFIFVPRGLYTLIPLAALVRRGFYVSEFVNSRQAVAVKPSVPPSRLVVSRTRITPLPLAVSTHAPPLLSL